jgi:peptide/nickel transport system substrate-binding protein
MTLGQAQLVESWFPAFDPRWPEVQDAVPRYPYDVGRAQRLLAQAGWDRGADGMLIHTATGERFEGDLWASDQIGAEREVTIIRDQWKLLGANLGISVLPKVRERGFEQRFPLSLTGEPVWNEVFGQFLHGRELATAQNNWSGRNSSGYNNPRFNELADRIQVTISPRDQIPLHRELLQVGMGEVATMPLYWGTQALLAVKGVKGPVRGLTAGWNIYEWDRE